MTDPAIHHLTVERTARIATLGGPDDPDEAVDECWVVCHGYRQLASRFIRRFRTIAGPQRRIVAPEGLSRFYVDPAPGRHGPESRVGATWMTRDDRQREIGDYVAYLDQVGRRFAARAERRVVLGFSQGAHTAARWVAHGSHAADRLILWGAYLPPDLDLVRAKPRLDSVDLVQVQGEEDGTRSERLESEQDERLASAGLLLRKVEHPGGHRINAACLSALATERP